MSPQGFIARAEMIILNLRHCNDGADIHEVASMRAAAIMLIQQLNESIIDDVNAQIVLECIEKRQISYFKKKFANI